MYTGLARNLVPRQFTENQKPNRLNVRIIYLKTWRTAVLRTAIKAPKNPNN